MSQSLGPDTFRNASSTTNMNLKTQELISEQVQCGSRTVLSQLRRRNAYSDLTVESLLQVLKLFPLMTLYGLPSNISKKSQIMSTDRSRP